LIPVFESVFRLKWLLGQQHWQKHLCFYHYFIVEIEIISYLYLALESAIMDFRGQTCRRNCSAHVSLNETHYHSSAVAWERVHQGNGCDSKEDLKEATPPPINGQETLLASFSIS